MNTDNIELKKQQMRKGLLEFCILLVISKGEVYSSDILDSLKVANLIVVEGTLYPLLSRMRTTGMVSYSWEESSSGPPRKYYSLTEKGRTVLEELEKSWVNLSQSINKLQK